VDTNRFYTFGGTKQAARDFGRGLQWRYQWLAGETVTLFSSNSIDIPIVIWGTHWAGGVVSPANPVYTSDELAHQLQDSSSRLLVTELSLLPIALIAAAESGIPQSRILLLGEIPDQDAIVSHFTSIHLGIEGSGPSKARVIPERQLAFLVYSSATTGLPKGVMLSHRNIIANILQLHAGDGGNLSWNGGTDGKGDRVLGFLPFYHIYGESSYVHSRPCHKYIPLP
jgi:acyl-CoA synthetase (AMP-forming)/AMP-acid ligase II